MERHRDIAGQRFGSLTAIERMVKSRNGTWKWKVKCDCGEEEIVFITVLTSGRKLCCLKCFPARQAAAKITHGATRSTEYIIWKNMKARCENPNHDAYRNYGGRGITVDPAWSASFEKFYEDMGPRPADRSLDRRDNDKGYSQANCRWATAKEQANNRRTKITESIA